jgi:two-component sensor histidine kinase
MNRLLELACKMAAIDCGAVYIIDPQTGTANLAAQHGLTPGFVGLISSYAPDSPQVERARAGKTTCGRWEETRVSQDPAMDSEGLRGLISTPIFYNGELIAVLSLASHRTAGIPVATQHAVEAIAAVAGGTLVRIRAETALLIAVTQDISERRRAEAELRRYAETQATLLREVNHRVKNNLAAILSIVHKEEDLALTRGADSSVPMLRDLAARLQALAIVHQLLSGSAWRPLSLSELCENIIRSAMKSVHLNSPGDVIVQNSGVEVGSSEAHHLALVINELAINSLKHGTAGGRPVRIEVGIEADETSTTLHFRDDGPGYPAKILSEPSSTLGTGMDLVIGIIRKSLRGTLSLANKGGARATITFPNSLSDAELKA